ncbi:DNA methyltransferase, partial [Phascolarctobacterium succinatutens]
FCGSGTTGVEALCNGCNFIGIDNVEEYLLLTQKRLDKEKESLFI